jgi:hypothetical protein
MFLLGLSGKSRFTSSHTSVTIKVPTLFWASGVRVASLDGCDSLDDHSSFVVLRRGLLGDVALLAVRRFDLEVSVSFRAPVAAAAETLSLRLADDLVLPCNQNCLL